MEKVISNELTKYLIILGAGTIAMAALLINLVGRIKGSFKSYRRATLIYLLAAIVFFSVIAIIAHPALISKPASILIILQTYFLLLGIAHLYFMSKNLSWNNDGKAFTLDLLFTVLVSLMGAIGFLVVFHWVNERGLEYLMAGSIFFFIVPFFFYHTFQRAIAIPPKIVKEWFYPIDQEIEEPEDSKMKNLKVISFEFRKQPNDPHNINFRAKAPNDMDFGELFYFFINDYNERNPNSKIQFANANGESHGWIFYKKNRWHSIRTDYIDADKTIFNNKIQENDVIICIRSLE